MSERTNCQYPTKAVSTAYTYGCRCAECMQYTRDTAKKFNKKYKNRKHVWYVSKRENFKKATLALKIETLTEYGGLICKCCGETEPTFLCLDHKKNNGKEERRCWGNGNRFYSTLKRLGFPKKENYQVLCFNCNNAKRIKGICPHKSKISVRGY